MFFFYKLLLKLRKYSMGQYKQSKLQALYRHQKHAARIMNFKDKFTSTKPLHEQINAVTVYEMNIFQTLCFIIFVKMEAHRQFLKSNSPLPKTIICFNDNASNLMKNAFYFILKALLFVKIFKFLSCLFVHVEKTA